MHEHDGESARVNGKAAPQLVPRAAEAPESRESWLMRTGLSVSVWTLAAVATALAASGQVQFARWAGITDIRAYAVPAVLELVAVAFLLIGYRRARRGDSPYGLWFLASLVGGFAVYTNVVHSGGRSGLVFGAASAITLILWFVKLRDDYRHHQRHTGQATRPRPKLGALWMVAPRLSTRAWVLAARRRISTVDEAVAFAEVWRAVYEDARGAKVRRRLARRTAWRSVAQAAGGIHADLPLTAEVAAVDVVHRGASGQSPLPRSAAQQPALQQSAAHQSAAQQSSPPQPARAPVEATVHTGRSSSGRPGTDLSPIPHLVAEEDNGGPGSLRSRVFDFLDSQASIDDYFDVADGRDPYLVWMTARGLGVSEEAVERHVWDWCRRATERRGAFPES